MVIATLVGGIFFYAVHIFAAKMPPDEYGVFNALLQVLNQMAIPAVGLQTIFVQQSAMADSERHRRELTGAVRSVLTGTFIIWIVAVVIVLVFQKHILEVYKIQNPVALWATLGLGLAALWTPVTTGLLQGQQNFLWLGINSMLPALVRLVMIALIVAVFGGYAAGATVGVLLSMGVGVALGLWKTRYLWSGKADPFIWTPWLWRVLPLTLGLGATTFMFTWDMIAVQRFLSDTGLYGAAGMIGRALMFLVAPMTAVMFPKIVQSAAKAERTDVLAQALGATALLGCGAALFCTFFAEFPLRMVQGEKYIAAAPLVPWFTWCMLPLTVSNVLASNLLARQRYAVVPWLVAVAGGYGFTLWFILKLKLFGVAQNTMIENHKLVIQTLGIFSTLFFLVCVWFTWKGSKTVAADSKISNRAVDAATGP